MSDSVSCAALRGCLKTGRASENPRRYPKIPLLEQRGAEAVLANSLSSGWSPPVADAFVTRYNSSPIRTSHTQFTSRVLGEEFELRIGDSRGPPREQDRSGGELPHAGDRHQNTSRQAGSALHSPPRRSQARCGPRSPRLARGRRQGADWGIRRPALRTADLTLCSINSSVTPARTERSNRSSVRQSGHAKRAAQLSGPFTSSERLLTSRR